MVNGKQYRIGTVANNLGITPRSIRYYEEIGLMRNDERNGSNYRMYDENDTVRLKFIIKLKELGISLKEMKELAVHYDLNNKKVDMMVPRLIQIIDLNINKIDEKILNLKSLRKDIDDYRCRIMNCVNVNQQCGEFK